jgi:energy-coupling factor transport system permease protein
MANEMLGYIKRDSFLHRLTGATKLICFLLWSTAAMLTYDTRVLSGFFILSIVLFMISKIKLREIAFVLGFILLFLLLNNVAIFIFDPNQGSKIYGTQHLLTAEWGRYKITLEQIFYQLNITLKYFVVIPPALLFILTTQPSEFAASLNKIGISYRLSYAVAIALRYIPEVQRDYQTISLAQQARGVDVSRNEHIMKRVKNIVSIIVPLIFSSLEKIETISNVMDMRGFGQHKKRTWYSQKKYHVHDLLAIGFSVALLVITISFFFVNDGRFYNPF